jgi:hypothetical protein
MAARFILTPYSAEFAGLANYPQLMHVNGQPVLAFDAATNESVVWSFRLPANWTGTPTLVVQGFMASAVAGTVDATVEIQAVTPLDALNLNTTASYDAANSVTGTTVPAATGNLFAVSFTSLTNFDSGAAGDWVRLKLTRGATGDTAAGDWYVVAAALGDGA